MIKFTVLVINSNGHVISYYKHVKEENARNEFRNWVEIYSARGYRQANKSVLDSVDDVGHIVMVNYDKHVDIYLTKEVLEEVDNIEQ